VVASTRLGHPTFALVRDMAPSDAAKAALLKSFQDAGVTLVKGDLYDQASLVGAVRLADVVISTVGAQQIADQTRLIDAIKEAGNVKVHRSAVRRGVSMGKFASCSCVHIQGSKFHKFQTLISVLNGRYKVFSSYFSCQISAEMSPNSVFSLAMKKNQPLSRHQEQSLLFV
jgi:hypothetical protein